MISEEAVEVGVRAVHELWMQDQAPWENLSDEQKEDYRAEARAVLGAVQTGWHHYGDGDAAAWNRGFTEGVKCERGQAVNNPYGSPDA